MPKARGRIRLARRAAPLAWSVWTAGVALTAASLYLSHLNGELSAFGTNLYMAAALLAFPTAGAVIASRRPYNPLGWLYLAVMPLVALAIGSGEYATYALGVSPGALPLARFALWVSVWAWVPALGVAFMIIPLLLPNGRLPSAAWRPFVWFLVLAGAGYTVMNMLAPITTDNYGLPNSMNPYGISALGPALIALLNVGDYLTTLLILVCASSLVSRYRRAGQVERRQLKWIGLAGAFVIACLAPLAIMQAALPGTLHLAVPAFALAITAIPVATAIALLDHRLVDVERVIRGLLLVLVPGAALAGLYAFLAFGLRLLLPPGSAPLELVLPVPALAVLIAPLRRATGWLVERHAARAAEHPVAEEGPPDVVSLPAPSDARDEASATAPDADPLDAASYGEKAA